MFLIARTTVLMLEVFAHQHSNREVACDNARLMLAVTTHHF